MNENKLNPLFVFTADNDVRYVPMEGAALDFCALAHESRYNWILRTQNFINKKVLDFGCGSGYGTFLLSQKAEETVGIDYSPSTIEFAKQNYSANGARFFNIDAVSEEQVLKNLEKNHFDYVVSFDVIEHIEKYHQYLKNISKLIKKDGTLIIGCPNRLQTLNWNRDLNECHKQEFSPEEFKALLSIFFNNVTLYSQDFHDIEKREEARKRNYGTDEPLPALQYRYDDISFTPDPPAVDIEMAFGLTAVCSNVKEEHEIPQEFKTPVKILLVEPKYSYDEALPWIPIGKGYMAAVVREHGFSVNIIDNALRQLSDEQLISWFNRLKPDIICLGGMTLQFSDTKRVARLARQVFDDKVFLLGGGVHLTLKPEDGLDIFDMLLLGESEDTFLEVCSAYEKYGKNIEEYQNINGLIYRLNSGEIIKTPARNRIKNLDKLPLPAYDLLQVRQYNDMMITGEHAISIMTSRGCPFNCEFCASPQLSKRLVTYFSLDYTFRLIEHLIRNYGIKNIRLMDDAFTLSKKRVMDFCDGIEKRGIKLNMACLTHVHASDAEMFARMKQVGFSVVALGIESGNEEVLKLVNKGMKKEEAVKAIKMARDAGLIVEGLFMIGNIGENEQTINDSIEFAKKHNPAFNGAKRTGFNWFQFATPFPGSRFFNEAGDYGEVISSDFDLYTHQVPVYIPKGTTPDMLVALRERAQKETNSTNENEGYAMKENIEKEIRILHVGWGHPPNLAAGPIYYLHNVCLHQKEKGYNVACFVASNEQGTGASPEIYKEFHSGIEYNIVTNRPAHYFDWDNPAREVSNPEIENLFQLYLEEFRPHVVHFHNLVGLSMSLPAVAGKFGCYTIFSAHNYWTMCPKDDLFATNETICPGPGDGARCATCVSRENLNIDFMNRAKSARVILSNSVDIILAVSTKVKDILAGFGVPQEKIIVQHIGSKAAEDNWEKFIGNINLNKIPNPVVNFGYFGTISPRKGSHIVLEAVKLLGQITDNFVVKIFGYCPPGAYQNRLNATMENDTFLSEHVKFMGGYYQKDIFELASGLDAAIIPPVWEDNGPQTVMETLAAGLPVIGSDAGGIPDFVNHGVNGLLFETANPQDLCNAMAAAILEEGLLDKLKEGIKPPVTIARHVEELNVIYKSLIASNVKKLSLQESKSFKEIKELNEIILKQAELGNLYIAGSILSSSQKNGVPTHSLAKTANILSEKRKQLISEMHPDAGFLEKIIRTSEELIGRNMLEEARTKLLTVLNMYPDNTDALNNLAVIFIMLEDYKTASELLAEVLSVNPNDEIANDNMNYLNSLSESSVPEKLEFILSGSFAEYSKYFRKMQSEYRKRENFERGLIKSETPFTYNGYCNVCKEEVGFQVDFLYSYDTGSGKIPNWRERLVCPKCNLNNRLRASLHIIEDILQPDDSAGIFITEQTTDFYRFISNKYSNVIGSEYLGDKIQLGEVNENGMRNEDLTKLTFKDNSFDAVLSFEVLEHIPDYMSAVREILRVLKPGGRLLFSVPFDRNSKENIVRAVIENGEVKHLLPPEYHGDPINSESPDGCLCFYHFGWELLNKLKEAGFAEAKAVSVYSEEYGYLGGEQMFFIAEKKGEPVKKSSYVNQNAYSAPPVQSKKIDWERGYLEFCKGEGIEIGSGGKPIPGLNSKQLDLVDDYNGFKYHVDYLCPADDCSIIESSKLDYIIHSNMIEHLANPAKAFLEWHRILKPGGILYMIVPDKRLWLLDRQRNVTYPKDWTYAYDEGRSNVPGYPNTPNTHFFAYTPSVLIECLKQTEVLSGRYKLVDIYTCSDKTVDEIVSTVTEFVPDGEHMMNNFLKMQEIQRNNGEFPVGHSFHIVLSAVK